jgi:uncharacterized protein with von Willebrand factor type A (vWA) domain
MSRDVSIEFGHWIFDTSEDLEEQLLGFPMDEDWKTNEEYFQDDTLDLGYESEAQRLASEWLQEHQVRTEKDLEAWIKHLEERVYNHDQFYIEQEFSIIEVGPGKFAVAYYVQTGW